MTVHRVHTCLINQSCLLLGMKLVGSVGVLMRRGRFLLVFLLTILQYWCCAKLAMFTWDLKINNNNNNDNDNDNDDDDDDDDNINNNDDVHNNNIIIIIMLK